MMRTAVRLLCWVLAGASMTAIGGEPATDPDRIDRGRYLITVSGCNDCHTPAYMESNGNIPEADWLIGAAVGFQGPWGTSYPSNLRRKAELLTEAQWLARARTTMLPPMPWFNLRQMHDDDLRAIYAYLRYLGPAGEDAPTFVPPGDPVATPYIEFMPRVSVADAGR